MSLAFTDLKSIMLNRLSEDDSTTSTECGYFLNMAQREIARARPWPFLRTRKFFNTVVPYSAGTIATNGTTTVTLTAGTWPTDVATNKYKVAKSYNDPWYYVATRSSGAVILLAEAYAGANETASTYVAWKDQYSLDSTVDVIEEMWLHQSGRSLKLEYMSNEAWVSDYAHYSGKAGVPLAYMVCELDASGNKQVRLGPCAPDAVYRVEYTFRKTTTDDTYGLGPTLEPVVLERAMAYAYERDHYERAQRAHANADRMLERAWIHVRDTEAGGITVGAGRLANPGGWPASVMDYGTPSGLL